FLLLQLSAHEQVGEREVGQDFFGRVNLEIARGQTGKVGQQLFRVDGPGQQAADVVGEQLALFLLGANERRDASELAHGFVEEQQQQRIFKPVPQLVARAERVGKGMESEQPEVLSALDFGRKTADDGRVVQVAALGNLAHVEVVFDDQPQRMGV